MKTKSKPIVIKADYQHCIELAPNIRNIDSLEMHASNTLELSNEDLLKVYLELSSDSYAVIYRGKCLAIFGVKREDLVAIPWMIMTDDFINKHSRVFLKECKDYLNKLLEGCKYSFNFISVDNTKSQRWLEWLGFTIHKDRTMLIRGVNFCLFDKGLYKNV